VSWETSNPYAVVDVEEGLGRIVVRYETRAKAEWYLTYLARTGGSVLRAKVERGGYGIDGPEDK